MNTQIEALKAVLPLIADTQKGFADSLVHQFEKKGVLSDKQWYWVGKLADTYTVDPDTVGIPDFTKEITHETVGNMSGLIDLFQVAKKHLKYPSIVLALPDGSPLRVYMAGTHSKTPGYLQVTDNGNYGVNKWYGRVSPTGAWEKSPIAINDTQLARTIQILLQKLSVDPAGTAAEHGKLHGRCCFCSKVLTDKNSTDVGYGPTCAKSFGLPWGLKH